MSIYSIGVGGLNAAQAGLYTTSHNISNASTAGFNRQQIIQTTNTPMFTGSGYIGQGTNVQTVQRVYSKFLTAQVLNAQAGSSEMDTYLTQLNQINNLLGDSTAGLAPALSDFFKGVQDVAANPSNIPARQSMLSMGKALVARFQGLDARISEIRDGVNQQITTEAVTINALAQQLGNINQQIITAQAAGMNQPPNDLLDQRDIIVANLNKEIKIQVVEQSDGTLSAFIGNGQPLVVGTQTFAIAPIQAQDDPEKIALAMTTPQGATIYLQDSVLTGGNLGGLISFRNESLDVAENSLGRIAMGLANSFNDLHMLGQDLNGAPGKIFFNVPTPEVKANAKNASSASVVSAAIIDSDYRIDFDGANYNITRVPANPLLPAIPPSAALPVVVDGVHIQLSLTSGAPNAGDVFLVRPGNPASSRVIAESDNTGAAILESSASNMQAMGTSDYRLDYTGPGAFLLTRLSDNASWVGNGVDEQTALDDLATKIQTGVALSFSGTPATVGDSFLIRPVRTAARNLSVAVTDPSEIAAGMAFRTAATLSNQGTAKIDAGVVLDNTFLPLPATGVTLTFNTALNQFTVAGAVPAVGNIPYNPGTASSKTISFNGLSFTISGTPKNGDSFTLMPNSNGVSDNRTAQLLGGLQVANSLSATAYDANSVSAMSLAFTSSATVSFQGAYAQLISNVGNKAREVTVTGEAQQALVDQSENARQSLSGVNLDEEAANLMRYQQAYQAAAKMLDIANKMFDEIIALGR
ncbi:MAG: flagellar hook-associated protein FlgK [Rhodocyclaceae bacterium]|nr:flagellar hook-associated protein FlgK [Rhodocyclaceae bacterium]